MRYRVSSEHLHLLRAFNAIRLAMIFRTSASPCLFFMLCDSTPPTPWREVTSCQLRSIAFLAFVPDVLFLLETRIEAPDEVSSAATCLNARPTRKPQDRRYLYSRSISEINRGRRPPTVKPTPSPSCLVWRVYHQPSTGSDLPSAIV